MRLSLLGSSFGIFFERLSALILLLAPFNHSALAAQPPICWSNEADAPLSYMNQTVIEWTHEAFSQHPKRALIQGRVTKHVRSRKTHEHFEVSLGDGPQDKLEVVYSKSFGRIHSIKPGMTFEACGDFLNVQRTHKPDGSYELGIIHWVHYNPGDRDGGKHEHGYVMLDGTLYGQEKPPRDAFFSLDWMEWMWNPSFADAVAQP